MARITILGRTDYAGAHIAAEAAARGDVLVADAEGRSTIGGAGFGIAVVDEIETPTHRRARFTVGY